MERPEGDTWVWLSAEVLAFLSRSVQHDGIKFVSVAIRKSPLASTLFYDDRWPRTIRGQLTVEGSRYRGTFSARAWYDSHGTLQADILSLEHEDIGTPNVGTDELAKLALCVNDGYRVIAQILGIK